MRRRIYWLLPDLASARRTMDDLLIARVAERHIHFVARDGADMTGLPPANVLQTSDVIRAAGTGLVVGTVLGAIAGVVVGMFYPYADELPQPGLVVVLALLGAAMGAWTSSLIGISIPSRRLARFAPSIATGSVLLMVDVRQWRIREIEALLQALHPEARLEGIESRVPVFP